MVNSRSDSEIIENPSNPNAQEVNEDNGLQMKKKISDYEQCREERIKENLERMQKLGIFDLSLRVKSLNNKPTPKSRKTPFNRTTPPNTLPLPPPGPVRRSSRLQNATPVSYSEAYLNKKDITLESLDDSLREEGSRPEIYTEEHEKLLGSTEMSWTLFVDGVGNDGKRIYDPVKGKTCHQCRQKTLGRRTHCSQCNMVQGQFCGDCLYMRYGEHVIEANQNPNWKCPVCRGICNCSLCRKEKGWPPTGALYRKISSLGYKSVAHYLMQTRRQKTEAEADSNSKVPFSAKRSLPFEHVEETSTEMVLVNCYTDPQVSGSPQSESTNAENLACDKLERKMQLSENEDPDLKHGNCKLDMQMKLVSPTEMNAEDSLPIGPGGKETDILTDKKYECSNVPVEENVFPCHEPKGTFQIDDSNHESNKEEDKTYMGNSEVDCILAPESNHKSSRKRVRTIEPAGDSIARRLRSKHTRVNEQEHTPALVFVKQQDLSAEADANY